MHLYKAPAEDVNKDVIDTHKITGKADGSISRMPSPADVDPLD